AASLGKFSWISWTDTTGPNLLALPDGGRQNVREHHSEIATISEPIVVGGLAATLTRPAYDPLYDWYEVYVSFAYPNDNYSIYTHFRGAADADLAGTIGNKFLVTFTLSGRNTLGVQDFPLPGPVRIRGTVLSIHDAP